MELNKEQKLVLEMALKGHSMVILGQSGTGKSFLGKVIAKELIKCGVATQMTATTGIAALNVNGKTVHSWSGIADGRYSNETLFNKLLENEHFGIYKDNILQTKCLIIDEISMLSRKLFQQLEFVCRKLKNKFKVFGGMQVIAIGDFFQLAPVPDEMKGDDGDYCFKSSSFTQIFSHKFVLSEVLRQQQLDFVKAVNDISKGELPVETCNLIKRLHRNLPPGNNPIRLSARNFDCLIYNACKLIDLPGEDYVFHATDTGKVNKLENIPVPKSLHLKLRCPVMLLKNLSDRLVNGLRGHVTHITQDTIAVNFDIPNSNDTCFAELKRENFPVYSSMEEKVIATRKQFPVCLSYSITIHKSQGLTLDRVEVDASNIFAAGQLGVAIGRVREKKSLRVIGFTPRSVIKHDQSLYEYQCATNNKFDDQLECCNHAHEEGLETITNPSCVSTEYDREEELSDFSEGEMQEIDFLLSQDTEVFETKPTPGVRKIVNIDEISEIFDNITSKRDEEIKSIFRSLKASNAELVENFANNLFGKIYDILNTKVGDVETKSIQPKEWAHFYSDLYRYSVSDEYSSLVAGLSLGNTPTSSIFEMCGKVFESQVIKKRSQHLYDKLEGCDTRPNTEISESSHGKIRYIFGRCVEKSRYHEMKCAKNNLYNKKQKDKVTNSFVKTKLLDSLTTNSHALQQNSKYKNSLDETSRKQNVSQGLTNITDCTFEFALKLEKKRILMQNDKSFHIHGSNFLSHCHNVLLKDSLLFNDFRCLFQNFAYSDTLFSFTQDIAEICLRELFENVVKRYCRVGDNEFRKDFMHCVHRKKTERLRKTVDTKSNTNSKKVKVSNPSASIVSEDIKEPVASSSHESEPTSSSAGNSTVAARITKPKLRKKKKNQLTSKSTKKCERRKHKTENQDDTICPLCQAVYKDGEAWVACDICDTWFDRKCLNISDNDWEILQQDEWFCPLCAD